MRALPWYKTEAAPEGTPRRWAMQNEDDRNSLECLAELWVAANDPAVDFGPAERLELLDTVRFIADDLARVTARMLAELAPRPPTAYCNGCRAWCRIPHVDCIGVPLWVRMLAVRPFGMPVRDIDRGLRSGALVYDPEARAIHRPEEIAHVG